MSEWTPENGLLLLDEPTAALGGEDVGRLFEAVKTVASHGVGIVFVSHRIDEVLTLAHRVVALRDGRVVADLPVADVDHDRLVSLIAGRRLESVTRTPNIRRTDVLLVDGLHANNLDNVSFSVRSGEVVGVHGLLGSGREHLAPTLFGAMPRHGGSVTVSGVGVTPADPRSSIRSGLALVPADRLRHGAVMSMSATENLTLPSLRQQTRPTGSVDTRAERRLVKEWASRIELNPSHPERLMRLFSGGNQQKVVMAKWLRLKPRVLLLDEPTQGVDVGAKAAICRLVAEAAGQGTAVLVASSEINELLAMCDRVLIMRRGRLAAELSGEDLNEERLIAEALDPSDPESEDPL